MFKMIPHPEFKFLLEILGYYLTITGFFDAYKYHVQANAIRKVEIAKGHSRRFINWAIHNDLARIVYFLAMFFILGTLDIYLFISSLIAIIFMVELWFVIYRYYPYRMRGCSHFKRPSIWIYFLNSLLSNRIRKRL